MLSPETIAQLRGNKINLNKRSFNQAQALGDFTSLEASARHRGIDIPFASRYDEGREGFAAAFAKTERELETAYGSPIFGTNQALSEYNLGLRRGGDLALGGEKLPDNLLYTPERHYAYAHQGFLDSMMENSGELNFQDPRVQEIMATVSKGKPVASEALLADPTYGSALIQFDTPGIEDIKLQTAGIDPSAGYTPLSIAKHAANVLEESEDDFWNAPEPPKALKARESRGFALFGRAENNRWEGIIHRFADPKQEAFPEFLNSQIFAEHLSEWTEAEPQITRIGPAESQYGNLRRIAKVNQKVYAEAAKEAAAGGSAPVADFDILFREDRAYRFTDEFGAEDLLEDIKAVNAGKLSPEKATIVGVDPLAGGSGVTGLMAERDTFGPRSVTLKGGIAPDPYFAVGTPEFGYGPRGTAPRDFKNPGQRLSKYVSGAYVPRDADHKIAKGNILIESAYDESTWLDMYQGDRPSVDSTVPPRAPTLADPVRIWKHNPETETWDILYDNIGDQARITSEIFEADPVGWKEYEKTLQDYYAGKDKNFKSYIPDTQEAILDNPIRWGESELANDEEVIAFKKEFEKLVYGVELPTQPTVPAEAIKEAEATGDFTRIETLKAQYADEMKVYRRGLNTLQFSGNEQSVISTFQESFRNSREYDEFIASLPTMDTKIEESTSLRRAASGETGPQVLKIGDTAKAVRRSYSEAVRNFVKRKGAKQLAEQIKEKLPNKGILGALLAVGVGVGLPSVASASTLGAAAGSSSGGAGLAVLGGVAAVGALALGYSRINPATRSRITSSVGSALGKIPNIMSVASSRGGFIERELELTTKGLAGSMSSVINEWGFNRRESATGGTIDTRWGRAWTAKGLGKYVAPAEEGWIRVAGKRELYTQWDDYITNSRAVGAGVRRFAYGLLGGKNSSANRWLARMGGFGTVLPTGIALYFAGKDAVEGYHENGILGGVSGAAQGYLKAAVANRIIGGALLNPLVGIMGLGALGAAGYAGKRIFEVMTEGNLYLQNNRQRTSWTTNVSMSIASSTVATMRQRAIAAIENSKYSSMKSLGNEAYMITSPRSRYASNTIMGNSSPMMSY